VQIKGKIPTNTSKVYRKKQIHTYATRIELNRLGYFVIDKLLSVEKKHKRDNVTRCDDDLKPHQRKKKNI
jgi:hypothetical protein